MANKEKKEAFAALDNANKEYKKVCSNLENKYVELDKTSDDAIALITDVENLIESIRHKPWSYKATKHKIDMTKKDFIATKDLKRKERNNNITAGVLAGGAAAGGISLIVFMKAFCKDNIIKWIICLALFIIVLVAFLIYKIFNSVKTAKKAYEQIKIIKEEINKNQILYSKADAQKQKIESNTKVVREYVDRLKECADCNYRALPEETKDSLGTLYNLTLTLTELVNAQIG